MERVDIKVYLYITLLNNKVIKKRVYDLFANNDKTIKSFLSEFNDGFTFIDGKYILKNSILYMEVKEE